MPRTTLFQRDISVNRDDPEAPVFSFKPLSFEAKLELTLQVSTMLETIQTIKQRETTKKDGENAPGADMLLRRLWGDADGRRQVLELMRCHCREVRNWQIEDEAAGELRAITVEEAFELLDAADFTALVLQLSRSGLPGGSEKNSAAPSQCSVATKR